MHYVLERIQKICHDLKDLQYRETVKISDYKKHDGNFKNLTDLANRATQAGWENFTTGDLWGGYDKHCWFTSSVTVPEHFAGQPLVLEFYTFDEGWDATNPQFMLYIDGVHVQGLDINHREYVLTNAAVAGQTYTIDLHAYSGLNDKQATLHGVLAILDRPVRDLYYDLQVPIWVCEKLEKEDKRRIDMLTTLNDAINLLDFRKVRSEAFDASVEAAHEFLAKNFYDEMCGHSETIATCIGHTHIDVAWHWTVAQTHEKTGRSFATVLSLMNQYPEYKFMSSQPQLYEFLKEDYPTLYAQVKERVAEGRWEPEGAMWLEADCNVTSGESLVRQILFGKRFFKEEFGVDNKVLWLPDVFGYSAALPQIMKKTGIEYFMTTKIAWNQFNKIPYDTFKWRGIDGTEILTHFITTKDPYQEKDSFFTTYNGNLHPGAVIGAWDRYQQKALNNDVMISYGHGDGGGGPTYEMLEVGRRLEKGIPGAPRVQQGHSLDYFKRLDEKVGSHPKLPTWAGELYLEYHRGTYTSMARNKRDNRKSEQVYQSLEKMNTFAMLHGKSYPQAKINKHWKTILLNQFHDILPGTSIQPVYEVTAEQYAEILADGREMLAEAIGYIGLNISTQVQTLLVTNTLSFVRDDIVEFDAPEGMEVFHLTDGETRIACQKTHKGTYVAFVQSIPANGYKTLEFAVGLIEAPITTVATTTQLENQYFAIALDDVAEMTSIFDKVAQREVLKPGQKGNQIQAFEDKPMFWDNWDIDMYYTEKMWPVTDVASIEIIEHGNVRSVLRIERKFVDSTIIQDVIIYANLPKIDFETYVDWKQSQVLLKAAFPVAVNTTKATYEIQYGNLERPTHKNTSWDQARFEVCAHKWADISEGDYGVSLLNESKYGHDIVDGNMRLTLLKSGTMPHPTTDQEEHFFTYSLHPHAHGWQDAQTVALAEMLNVPCQTQVLAAKQDGTLPQVFSLLSVDQSNILIEVIKKAEADDSIIVRMYENSNKQTTTLLTSGYEIVEAYETDMLEQNEARLCAEASQVALTFKPFEIKTIRIQLKK
ncbi:MAG: alpha-mannosidase [Culicoidibacterales bacterium]